MNASYSEIQDVSLPVLCIRYQLGLCKVFKHSVLNALEKLYLGVYITKSVLETELRAGQQSGQTAGTTNRDGRMLCFFIIFYSLIYLLYNKVSIKGKKRPEMSGNANMF